MSPTTFQIVSDLHLETHSYDYTFKQTAPNLALLGDIGQVADDALFVFLERQLNRYWNVFFLRGNHEPVHGSWPAARQRVRDFNEKMERLRAHSTSGTVAAPSRPDSPLTSALRRAGRALPWSSGGGQPKGLRGNSSFSFFLRDNRRL
ncbi:hypothetical protein C7999DRAFT_33520 [Corynascus novoguineensis]|uniref:Calcineurin-like phosphoesterase domain-containing protein n=1 Tax=Corynascus novoguineensis TaxID=1126955 RepID=A0AAN7HLW7_9PEZI|nr:hypothetical protein C7999DRAFT_33520 [Corynascus novoguineensis]